MSEVCQRVLIDTATQKLFCYQEEKIVRAYLISTAKNGTGERIHSECTPRGLHRVHAIIGYDHAENSVFKARQWTGELFNASLQAKYPERDWILTRIIQLDGLEPGKNKGGDVDTLTRFIYIHGTPDSTPLGIKGSHGCIRMHNLEIIELANWIKIDTLVDIH